MHQKACFLIISSFDTFQIGRGGIFATPSIYINQRAHFVTKKMYFHPLNNETLKLNDDSITSQNVKRPWIGYYSI